MKYYATNYMELCPHDARHIYNTCTQRVTMRLYCDIISVSSDTLYVTA